MLATLETALPSQCLSEFQTRCDEALAALEKICDDSFLPRLEAVRERIHHEKLKVLVVGEFSRGKSTLINALVGRPVLPARVNPTTATITVLNGSEPAAIRIQYTNGLSEDMPLPAEDINKYLDGILTEKNKAAHTISVVTIQLPGRLTNLHLEVVDTPGVNDLDEAREEITYRYLRQADVAILLLDAQQPLNKSEKLFLTQKIFQNDVRRILFVVNKIDDVLRGGSVSDIPRILELVRSRLRDEVGIDAEVFAVSARNTLRARFTNGSDPGPGSFIDFESALVRLAQIHASSGRWNLHSERIKSLIRDQIASLQQQCASVSEDLTEVRRNIETLVGERELIDSVVKRMDVAVRLRCKALSQHVSGFAYQEVEKLRSELLRSLKECSTIDQVQRFRSHLSAELRNLLQRIEYFASGYCSEMVGEIERDFRCALSERISPLERGSTVGEAEALVPAMPIMSTEETVPITMGWKSIAGGAGLGLLAGNLFGIVGLVAVVISGLFMSKSENERSIGQLQARARDQMVSNLEQTLAELTVRARNLGEQIGASEASRLSSHIAERAAQHRESAAIAIESSQKALCASAQEREIVRSKWMRRLDLLSELESRCLT